jgi:alpha-N-acetylglucosaminidase
MQKTMGNGECHTSDGQHAAGVVGLINRILPGRQNEFALESIAHDGDGDVFEIESVAGRIVLRASSIPAQAAALHWYLKHHCSVHLSWCGARLELPTELPPVETVCRVAGPYRERYCFNYCTFSYSMVWWDWARWEREIDWMALNGFTLPLALTGQEAVWLAVYRDMGLSDEEILGFIAGPAFLAWGWMGNLDGWGGPLPLSWIKAQEALQCRIVARQRELGMRPVLPTFTGHVPAALRLHFPDAGIRQLAKWAKHFDGTWLLDPHDPLFGEIGHRFISEQTRRYGTDHVYTCDSFNENCPPSNDPAYLRSMAASVYAATAGADPEALLVMQGWMFFFNPEDPDFWQEEQIRALLDGFPEDRLIVLDLNSDEHPVWSRTQSYYGRPWIWNVIHNFGGNRSMVGNLEKLASEPPRALREAAPGSLVGMGLAPEGIEQNPVVYDLATDMMWRRDPPELRAWVHGYLRRRYGVVPDEAISAWTLLLQTVYARPSDLRTPSSVLCMPPSLKNHRPTYYDNALLAQAWQQLFACADRIGRKSPYLYDLVDLTRQVLSNHTDTLQGELSQAFQSGDTESLAAAESRFLGLILDMDTVLGTRGEFLLGKWISDAKRWGETGEEKRLLEWNARTQLTLWGRRGSMLRDYARKEWNGLLRGYYLERWRRYFEELRACRQDGRDYDEVDFSRRLQMWEEAWAHGTEPYADEPSGDALSCIAALQDKYLPLLQSRGAQ